MAATIDIDVVVTQQFANAQLFRGIVFDDQQPLAAGRRILLDAREAPIPVRPDSSAW